MKEAAFFETIEAAFPTGGYEKAQTNAISGSHYEVVSRSLRSDRAGMDEPWLLFLILPRVTRLVQPLLHVGDWIESLTARLDSTVGLFFYGILAQLGRRFLPIASVGLKVMCGLGKAIRGKRLCHSILF
ncbi:hypothetical protein CDAR_223431 [Caerostris darwini]|uniref:Uncharacterized protein n=1 Tax=Caerostris darwini TaxID=1538125 RepID=A0AAV4W6J0_9ARAC|nr:hypothetical protein CDAR_223431 [Caerostris darwini]